MAKKLKLWVGKIPDIYGIGIIVIECTEAEALKTLKKEFYKIKIIYNGERTFNDAMDWFDGDIYEIETGEAYDELLEESL